MTITWEQVLAFLCEDQTMAITSLLFLAFFAAVALINYALPRVLRPYFLLAASYGFFCYDPVNRPLVWVIAAATVLTWLCGLIISKVRAKPVRVLALAASVGFGIGILIYYKYWNLLADTVGGSILSHRENLLAPLGLSYFTFASMSYTIDVYKRRCRVETNLLHYALFVSFFPTLINGPIERYPQMRPQIRKSRRFSYGRCAGGAFRMLWGYTKKMVLADNLSHYVSLVYGDVGSMSGPNLVAATVLFAVQLYMDFSGCCDIALGAARILGYDLIENFQSPFEARTFNDFWRRWHISMTSWFRDYVYIPLGGSRCRLRRTCLNLLIVFALTGLWHGADWRYLAWGLFTGLLAAFGVMTARARQRINRYNPLYRMGWFKVFWQCLFTNALFCLTLVFFASAIYNTDPFAVYGSLLQGWDGLTGSWAQVSNLIYSSGIDGRLPVVLLFGCFVVFAAEHKGRSVARSASRSGRCAGRSTTAWLQRFCSSPPSASRRSSTSSIEKGGVSWRNPLPRFPHRRSRSTAVPPAAHPPGSAAAERRSTRSCCFCAGWRGGSTSASRRRSSSCCLCRCWCSWWRSATMWTAAACSRARWHPAASST